ncbi:MAG: hypothetical protein CV082_08285 [Candidatus Brocadia sp. BL1]|nr:MAG: hypothetical protein CV082_08285 [Candidatus Brocadia sp. BL1]
MHFLIIWVLTADNDTIVKQGIKMYKNITQILYRGLMYTKFVIDQSLSGKVWRCYRKGEKYLANERWISK